MFASAVRRSAVDAGGKVTWKYSQAGWETVRLIIWNPHTRWGICAAMAAQWIVDHAYGGSLANRLINDDGKVSRDAIRRLMRHHSLASSGGDVSQRTAIEQFLSNRKIVIRRKSYDSRYGARHRKEGWTKPANSERRQAKETGTAMPDIAYQIAAALGKVRASYVLIKFGGRKWSHVIAGWLGRDDGCLFDPNSGEYWFQRKEKLCEWFPTYYRVAGYLSFPTKHDRWWSIAEFGLSANASDAYREHVLSFAGPRPHRAEQLAVHSDI
ncbi:MAG TPA: YopT-type cysteine protease domain-containing protein [Labilithrix sp.]|nr:YopT-type cysteine protease domain-containing protein [Labilithrix sp.]